MTATSDHTILRLWAENLDAISSADGLFRQI
jgi:hypothetical protein